MTSHYFDFDAVTHSIKDVSVSTRQSLASSELFRIHGYIADKLLSELKTEFRSGTWAKRIYLERLLSSCRAPLTLQPTIAISTFLALHSNYNPLLCSFRHPYHSHCSVVLVVSSCVVLVVCLCVWPVCLLTRSVGQTAQWITPSFTRTRLYTLDTAALIHKKHTTPAHLLPN